MTPEAIAQDLRSRSPADEDHDFQLTTDGSGSDGPNIGIASTYVLRPLALVSESWRPAYRGACAITYGNVDRAEMMALVEGLRMASILTGMTDLRSLEGIAGRRLPDVSFFPPELRRKILWFGDRQSLVYQVARDRSGAPYYARRREQDVWKMLEYYEHLFDITCVHIDRNTTPDARLCDEISGKLRQVIKSYHSRLNNDPTN